MPSGGCDLFFCTEVTDGLCLDNNSWKHLDNITDPRLTRDRRHKLVDILIVALCGFLAGCEGWVDVELFGRAKRSWLGKFLELPNGIPSHDTFGRVFALLDPDQLVRVLQQFVQSAWEIGARHCKSHRLVRSLSMKNKTTIWNRSRSRSPP